MPKFYVSVSCTLTEVFEFEDIEADSEDAAVELACDRAEAAASFEPDDVEVVDVEMIPEEEEEDSA